MSDSSDTASPLNRVSLQDTLKGAGEQRGAGKRYRKRIRGEHEGLNEYDVTSAKLTGKKIQVGKDECFKK